MWTALFYSNYAEPFEQLFDAEKQALFQYGGALCRAAHAQCFAECHTLPSAVEPWTAE